MPNEKTEFELARRKRRRRLGFERLGRLIIALCVTAAVIFGIYKAIDSDLIGMLSDRATAAATNGTGLPMEFAGNTVRQTFECNGAIGLVTDTAYYLYGTNGSQLLYEQHGMSEPAACSSGRRFMVYDRGGTKLVIRTRDSVLFEHEFPFSIVDAELSKNGWLTVVTGAQRYASQVAVYGPEYKETAFTWESSGEYVLSAAVGPDNRTIAAVSVGASGGEIYSSLHVFEVDAPEELASSKFEGSTILDVCFSATGDIKLIFDNMAVMAARDGKTVGQYKYSGSLLAYSSAKNEDDAALVFDKYKELRSCQLVILGDRCEVLSDTSIDGLVSGAVADDSGTAVYTPNGIYSFGTDGALRAVSTQNTEALKLLFVGNDIYAVGRGELYAPEFKAAPAGN